MQPNHNFNQISNEEKYSSLDFMEWIIDIGNEKILILITLLTTTIVAIVYSLIVNPTYTAKTLIISPSQQQGASSSSLNSISAIASMAGVGASRSQDDFYTSLLNSETLQDEVIKKLNFTKKYNSNIFQDLRQILAGAIKISMDRKGGFIIIEAQSDDALFAATLANTYVEELRELIGSLSYNNSQQNIRYFEKAIDKTQIELSEAKLKFQNAKSNSGILSNANLTESIYSQITTKEMQLNAIGHFSTNENPDVKRLQSEVSALRSQLFKNSNQDSAKLLKLNPESTDKIAVDAYRDIKSLEIILATLTSQYKASVTEAFSTSPFVQVLEVAKPPERRSKPKRTIIVLYSFFVGIILGLLIAIAKIKINKLTNDQNYSSNVKRIRESWLHIN